MLIDIYMCFLGRIRFLEKSDCKNNMAAILNCHIRPGSGVVGSARLVATCYFYLRDDKVSMLTHADPHKPLRKV